MFVDAAASKEFTRQTLFPDYSFAEHSAKHSHSRSPIFQGLYGILLAADDENARFLVPETIDFAMPHFMDQLAARCRARGNPVLVGLDPRRELLPPSFGVEPSTSIQAVADAYAAFCKGVIDVVGSLVPAVKPQAAFFEELGPAGAAGLSEVIGYAKSHGLLVILDAKRNDIGSTAEAYARGLLGANRPSDGSVADGSETGGAVADNRQPTRTFEANALTVSPYLGDDSLQPFVEVASERGCGVFVLVKTSNPGGAMFQDLVADGRPIYRHVGDYVEQLAQNTIGDRGYGAVGAVIGATYPEQLAELRAAMPQTWFLVPGYGSQGGTAADVAAAFDDRGLGAVVNNSRGILFAYRRGEYAKRFGPSRWQEAVEATTREMIAELRAETPAGKLTEEFTCE